MPTERTPLAERLWARVDRSGGPDACWPWTGCVSRGYGRISEGGKGGRQLLAHRVAFELERGPIPEGLDVDHECHNGTGCIGGDVCPHRRCCNPAHLRAVDHRTNMLASHRGARRLNLAKTHCPQGHPYAGANLRWEKGPDGRRHRRCRTCANERTAAGMRRRRTHLHG